ncbi:hypothetical protein [Desulfocurvus vexinensis]|uniref:hypothetical protein n=1 Tax=Desulfocurvus vexinensis TaxID=399548 RepID=UPI00048A9088|nr:hypothetical protein [Desulfocurvus vexinensis]
MSAAEKIHHIGKPGDGGDGAETPTHPGPRCCEGDEATRRDMSKVALFVSLLAVVLLVVFFFGLNQNLKGVSATVEQLAMNTGELTGRMDGIEGKVAELENLPEKSRMMVMGTMLQEMAQRAAYLGTQMQTEEQNEKLHRAMELLQQVQTEIATQ